MYLLDVCLKALENTPMLYCAVFGVIRTLVFLCLDLSDGLQHFLLLFHTNYFGWLVGFFSISPKRELVHRFYFKLDFRGSLYLKLQFGEKIILSAVQS